MNPAFQSVQTYLKGLQQNITSALTDLDGTSFLSDAWEKPAGLSLIHI